MYLDSRSETRINWFNRSQAKARTQTETAQKFKYALAKNYVLQWRPVLPGICRDGCDVAACRWFKKTPPSADYNGSKVLSPGGWGRLAVYLFLFKRGYKVDFFSITKYICRFH